MKAFVVIGLLVLAACAPFFQGDRPDAERTFDNALLSLQQDDFRSAYDDLSWVQQNYWHEPIGRQALLALTAVELNPRNPGRRLTVAAELGGRIDSGEDPPAWSIPVAETMRLVAVEITDLEARVATLEEEKAKAERQRDQAERARREAEAEAKQAAERARRAEATAAAAQASAREARATAARARTEAPVAAPAAEMPTDRDDLIAEVRTLRARVAEQERELQRIRESLTP